MPLAASRTVIIQLAASPRSVVRGVGRGLRQTAPQNDSVACVNSFDRSSERVLETDLHLLRLARRPVREPVDVHAARPAP